MLVVPGEREQLDGRACSAATSRMRAWGRGRGCAQISGALYVGLHAGGPELQPRSWASPEPDRAELARMLIDPPARTACTPRDLVRVDQPLRLPRSPGGEQRREPLGHPAGEQIHEPLKPTILLVPRRQPRRTRGARSTERAARMVKEPAISRHIRLLGTIAPLPSRQHATDAFSGNRAQSESGGASPASSRAVGLRERAFRRRGVAYCGAGCGSGLPTLRLR